MSTLDDKLDVALHGGIHSGYLTEITGERYVQSGGESMTTSTNSATVLQARPNFF